MANEKDFPVDPSGTMKKRIVGMAKATSAVLGDLGDLELIMLYQRVVAEIRIRPRIPNPPGPRKKEE